MKTKLQKARPLAPARPGVNLLGDVRELIPTNDKPDKALRGASFTPLQLTMNRLAQDFSNPLQPRTLKRTKVRAPSSKD